MKQLKGNTTNNHEIHPKKSPMIYLLQISQEINTKKMSKTSSKGFLAREIAEPICYWYMLLVYVNLNMLNDTN